MNDAHTRATVAATILRQLGGGRFTAMTGAKNLLVTDEGLQFKIPRAAKGINAVRVALATDDTYTVTFVKVAPRALSWATVREVAGVYADQLQAIFTAETGFYTHL